MFSRFSGSRLAIAADNTTNQRKEKHPMRVPVQLMMGDIEADIEPWQQVGVRAQENHEKPFALATS